MQVKTYRAETIREAIAKVKDMLGPEAMILATKKVEGKKAKSLFEIAAVPAGEDIESLDPITFGEVKSELTSIKEMIYLINHSDSQSLWKTHQEWGQGPLRTDVHGKCRCAQRR